MATYENPLSSTDTIKGYRLIFICHKPIKIAAIKYGRMQKKISSQLVCSSHVGACLDCMLPIGFRSETILCRHKIGDNRLQKNLMRIMNNRVFTSITKGLSGTKMAECNETCQYTK